MKNLLLLFTITLVTIGCQSNPPKTATSFDPSSAITISILIPKDEQIEQVSGNSVVMEYGDRVGYARLSGNYFKTSGYEVSDNGSQLTVSKIRGSAQYVSGKLTKTKTGRVTYSVKKTISKTDSGLEIQLVPTDKSSKIPFDVMQAAFNPGDFTVKELNDLLATPIFKVSLEFNSQYSVDSTASNFKRLGKKVKYRSPVKEQTGNLTKHYYEIEGDNDSYTVGLEVFPYREGSKVVLTSWLSVAQVSENHYNMTPAIADLKGTVEKIIAN